MYLSLSKLEVCEDANKLTTIMCLHFTSTQLVWTLGHWVIRSRCEILSEERTSSTQANSMLSIASSVASRITISKRLGKATQSNYRRSVMFVDVCCLHSGDLVKTCISVWRGILRRWARVVVPTLPSMSGYLVWLVWWSRNCMRQLVTPCDLANLNWFFFSSCLLGEIHPKIKVSWNNLKKSKGWKTSTRISEAEQIH